MREDGESFSSRFQVEWFDEQGNVVFTGEGTQQASRINVEPADSVSKPTSISMVPRRTIQVERTS